MELKKVKIPLFTKFTIGITFTVLLFGIINIYIVESSVDEYLNNELDNRGIFIAKSLVENSIGFVLSDNIVELNKTVNKVIQADSSIYYVFILDSKKKVIASTFNYKLPKQLIDANYPIKNAEVNGVYIKQANSSDILIKDYALTILDSSIGTVRVGLYANKIEDKITNTLSKLLMMILLFILVGIIGAFIFSYIIVLPIKFLSQKADALNLSTLKDINILLAKEKSKFPYKIRSLFGGVDEIDILQYKFEIMVQRLIQTNQKLEIAQKSLLQSEKMASIGVLTAGIAHEINNPIAGMKNCLSRIEDNTQNIEQTKRYLILMQEATQKIETVMQNLLSFSHKNELDFMEENISSVISKAIDIANLRSDKKGIDIIFNKLQNSANIKMNANKIEQVIVNIIFNAIDAIQEKAAHQINYRGKIEINVIENKNTCIIEISDNGNGIRQKNIQNIFDPFYTTKSVDKGTGLGLSICYQIINDHNGNIRAESIQGEGTKFIIELNK